MKLRCTFDYGTGSTAADVELQQEPDTSLTAKIQPQDDLYHFLKDDCYLEGIETPGLLLLQRTAATVTKHPVSSNGVGVIQAALGNAELRSLAMPSPNDLVTVRIYLINLPFTHRFNYSFKAHLGGLDLSITPVPNGVFTHVAEANTNFSDRHRVEDIGSALCWLCSLATGRLVSLAAIEVLSDEATVSLALHSQRSNAKLNAGLPLVLDPRVARSKISEYLEFTFPQYQQASSLYPVNNLIHMGILAKHTPYLQPIRKVCGHGGACDR